MIIASTEIIDFDLSKSIDELHGLLNTSTYETRMKDKLFSKINSIATREDYDKAKKNLLDNQLGIEGMVNPSQKDINKHVRKIAQPPVGMTTADARENQYDRN